MIWLATIALPSMKATGAEIIFPDDRQFYCPNEAPFIIVGTNKENEIGSFSIEGGLGLTDNNDNTATVYPELLAAGTYAITYAYVHGKVHVKTEDLTIGNSPEASFTWETECFRSGQPIRFKDNSLANGATITGYKWLFYHASGYDSLMTKDVAFTFPSPGNYTVELQVETSIGCPDTMVRVLALRPTLPLAGQNYFEDFEEDALAWQSGTAQTITANNWMLEEPAKGFDGAASGSNCWFTYFPTSIAPIEQSWVSSPCYDFTGTERPMIKLVIWRLFDGTRDGAVLQATADSGKSWQNVGAINDGINWFNADNVLGQPGGQSTGWSNIRDGNWMEARHSLDDYRNKQLVQFRIAYGSDGTARNTDGFAFDNVWIGERNKVPLIEHFTNLSEPSSPEADQAVNALTGSYEGHVIDLQYHTSHPGPDTFNTQNPQVPDARLLYYGLNFVPYTILDGGPSDLYRFDHETNHLNEQIVDIQSLKDGMFRLSSSAYVEGNSLHVDVEVTALQDIPSSELTLHIAVIENMISGAEGTDGDTEYHSVVKTLLPDAGGNTFFQPWSAGEAQHVTQPWDIHHVYDLDELRIVTFIQDEQTKEVVQSAMDGVQIHTGTGDLDENHQPVQALVVFMDPSSSHITVRFRESLQRDATLEMYNNLGSLIYAAHVPSGNVQADIPVAGISDGIYLIRLSDGNQVIGMVRMPMLR